MQSVEPEREMVRRALPLAAVALALALLSGFFVDGFGVAVSAALGVAVAFANFAGNAYLISWTASRNLSLLPAVAVGGFFVRMAVIMGLMFGLDTLAFFSPVAFICAVLPLAAVLLGVEAKMVMGPMGREVRVTGSGGSG